MSFTRAQVNAAKQALGLDLDFTYSLTITPTHVLVTQVALTDGVPDVRDGRLGMTEATHEIEEPPTDA